MLVYDTSLKIDILHKNVDNIRDLKTNGMVMKDHGWLAACIYKSLLRKVCNVM